MSDSLPTALSLLSSPDYSSTSPDDKTSLVGIDETDVKTGMDELEMSMVSALRDLERYATPPSSPYEMSTVLATKRPSYELSSGQALNLDVDFPPTPSPDSTPSEPEIPAEMPVTDAVNYGQNLLSSSKPMKVTSSSKAEGRPEFSYVALIAKALLAAPDNRLILADIYHYIQENYPFYQDNQRGWKNSIRHNLSLNDCFIKAGKADVGKGNFWSINADSMVDFRRGDFRHKINKRRRKRQQRHQVCGVQTTQPVRHSPFVDEGGYMLPLQYEGAVTHVQPPLAPPPAFSPPSALQHLAEMDTLYGKREPTYSEYYPTDPVQNTSNTFFQPFPPQQYEENLYAGYSSPMSDFYTNVKQELSSEYYYQQPTYPYSGYPYHGQFYPGQI